ncbi:hypothetical protein E4U60_003124 [Claviceps pazoutovae]|uniref:RRM domain-containing protein n=1 Tax=Claviceps pazoutovae TaxID=1649127 RepID=A0A9P7MAH5_9HYPO|nr:hypothetical protein E4U60_003124 [Claviceps pazoutovae]
MPSRSRSPSRGRPRSITRSLSPRSDVSRSPVRQRRHDSRSVSRSAPTPPRHNGRYRSDSRSWSRGPGRDSRDASESPAPRSTKIVVERLSKNINQDHLYEIFGQFGPIKDLDLPMNRTFGTNRGTAYILFDHEADAEAAISHMHEAQVDGAMINVSIVLPRRKLSPSPPTARRGAAEGFTRVAAVVDSHHHPLVDTATGMTSTDHRQDRLQDHRAVRHLHAVVEVDIVADRSIRIHLVQDPLRLLEGEAAAVEVPEVVDTMEQTTDGVVAVAAWSAMVAVVQREVREIIVDGNGEQCAFGGNCHGKNMVGNGSAFSGSRSG